MKSQQEITPQTINDIQPN